MGKRTEKMLLTPDAADVLDPFTLHVPPLSILRKVQIGLMTVTLLPLRLVLMFAVLLFAWLVSLVTLCGLPEEEVKRARPLSGWRRHWAKPAIVAMARAMFAIGGWVWIPQKGRRASPREAPLLLLTPHSSFLDTIPIVALGCPCLVVKDTTETTPFFGALVSYTQPVYVNRESVESRRHSADEIRRRVLSGQDWEQVLLFPEGACGNRKTLLQFKLGGFLPGVPVQPVFIRYPNKLDTITWAWDGPGPLKQLWLTLTQFRIYCELEFLPVYNPSLEEQSDPRSFAENVRRYISRQTGTPISHFSAEDARFLQEAKQAQLPGTAALVKLLRLRKKIGHDKLDPTKEVEILSERTRSWKSMKGNCAFLAEYLHTHETEALRDFFHIMNQGCQEVMDVRVYAAGVCLLKTEEDQWTRIKNAFQVFENQIGVEELSTILLLWWGLPSSVARKLFSTMSSYSNLEPSNTLSYGKFRRYEMELRKMSHTRSVS